MKISFLKGGGLFANIASKLSWNIRLFAYRENIHRRLAPRAFLLERLASTKIFFGVQASWVPNLPP